MFKINLNKAKKFMFVLFLFGPYIDPAYFSYMEHAHFVHRFYIIWLGLSIAVASVLFLILLKNKCIKKQNVFFLSALAMYFVTFCLSSAYNNANLTFNALLGYIKIIMFAVTIEVFVIQYEKEYLEVVSLYMNILLIINFVVWMLYPTGLAVTQYYENTIFFLGNKNSFAPIYVFTLCVTLLNIVQKSNSMNLRSFIYCSALNLSIIFCKSGTGIMCCLISEILLILFYKNIFIKHINMKNIIMLYVLLIVIIVFFQSNSMFEGLFNLFDKDVTLTGRTFLWRKAIDMITSSPRTFLLGKGFSALGYIYREGKLYTAHNMILEIMLMGGIISLFLYILMFILSNGNTMYKKGSNYYIFNKIIIAFVFVYLLSTITETEVVVPYLYGMLAMLNAYSTRSRVQ